MQTNNFQKAQSAAFTGHRFISYSKYPSLKASLRQTIKTLYTQGIHNFYCGMAIGFDMFAAEAVLSLKAELQELTLIAVVPYRGQSEKWSDTNRSRYNAILCKADQTILLSENYYKGCLLRRNDYMLSQSSCIIAYFDGNNEGGTFYTCRKAAELNLPVKNIF